MDIQQTLGNDAPLKAIICRWVALFKHGDVGLKDEECPEPLKFVTTPYFLMGTFTKPVRQIFHTEFDMS